MGFPQSCCWASATTLSHLHHHLVPQMRFSKKYLLTTSFYININLVFYKVWKFVQWKSSIRNLCPIVWACFEWIFLGYSMEMPLEPLYILALAWLD